MPNKPYDILVVDGTDFYPQVTEKLLTLGKLNYEMVYTYDEALKKLATTNYDLIMIDTEIGNKNGFSLLEYVQKKFPDLPYLMTTEHDIDKYMKPALDMQVGNMLVKPMKRDELLLLIEKLITKKGIFGLNNYLPQIKHSEIIQLSKTSQINNSIEKIMEKSKEWNFSFPNISNIKLVLYEMIVNALYHSHGYTEEKLKREHIELEDGKYVELNYGANETKFGISITDFNGKLTKSAILNTIGGLVTRDQKIQEHIKKGEDFTSLILDRGRGLDITRKLAGEYQINIYKNKKTEIILLFDADYLKDDNIGTIKIFEIA